MLAGLGSARMSPLALRYRSMRRTNRVAIGGKADILRSDWLGAIRCSVPPSDRFGLRQLGRR